MSKQDIYLYEVEASEVPEKQRAEAAKMVGVVSQELELHTPIKVHWFITDLALSSITMSQLPVNRLWAEDPPTGYVDDDKANDIWIRMGLDMRTLCGAVAHECRHLWQLQRYGRPLAAGVREQREKDADDHEQSFLARLIDVV